MEKRTIFILISLVAIVITASAFFYFHEEHPKMVCKTVCNNLIVSDKVYPPLKSLDSMGKWSVEGVSNEPKVKIPIRNGDPEYCLCKVKLNNEYISFQVKYDKWKKWYEAIK